jgi:hypothetical protein
MSNALPRLQLAQHGGQLLNGTDCFYCQMGVPPSFFENIALSTFGVILEKKGDEIMLLDKTSRKIMSIIIKQGHVGEFALRKPFASEKGLLYICSLDYLLKKGYIIAGTGDLEDGSRTVYMASPLGQQAYDQYVRETRVMWMTIILSAIGALSGFAGVIVSVISLKMQIS